MGAFTGGYFIGHDHLASFPTLGGLLDRLFNAAYFSVVTFTTLGYGDIFPALTCGKRLASHARVNSVKNL
jgi:hypothetical protein